MSRRAGTTNGSTQEPIMDKKDGEDRRLPLRLWYTLYLTAFSNEEASEAACWGSRTFLYHQVRVHCLLRKYQADWQQSATPRWSHHWAQWYVYSNWGMRAACWFATTRLLRCYVHLLFSPLLFRRPYRHNEPLRCARIYAIRFILRLYGW